MSDNPCCGNCRYFRQYDNNPHMGACKRHAPTGQAEPHFLNAAPVWPYVENADWCGDHEPKESKP